MSVRPPHRHLVFAIVTVALFMGSVDQTIVATALPTLQHDFGAHANWSSWTITVYALGQIVALPIAGRISDQYGRKRIFIAAVVVFTLASLCCGLGNNIYVLVALRAVQALGGGAFIPSATGVVADLYGENRDRAIGLFTSIFPIGAIVGPVLGGLFVTFWSWRAIFFVNVPIGAVLVVAAAVVIPPQPRRPAARLDWRGIAGLATGLIGVMIAFSLLGSGAAVGSTRFLAPCVCGLALLVLCVLHSARAADPFVPLALLRGRGFGITNLINFVWGAVVLGFGALAPLYAQQRFGIHALEAGTVLTARAVGMIGVAALSTFALRRVGYRLPMITGFLLGSVAILGMSISPPFGSPYFWLASTAAVFGIAVGLAVPAANNASLHLAPESSASIAGLRGMFRQMGGIAGIAIMTAASSRSAHPGLAQAHAFTVLAGVLLCLAPLVLLMPDHRGRW